MSEAIDAIREAVAEAAGAEESGAVLVVQVAQLIRDNAPEPTRLADLADELDARRLELARAIVLEPSAEATKAEA